MEAVKTRKVGKEGDSSGLKRENLGVKIAAHIIMVIAAVLAVLPFLMMISSSITSEEALARYGYGFIPMEVSFDAYSYLFKAWSTIGKAYFITIASTVSGTFLHMLVTTMFAFGLAWKKMPGRNLIMFLLVFTMLFSGGATASYVIWSNVFHINNTFFALILPNLLMNAFGVMLFVMYFRSSVSGELMEAAELDGAGMFTIYSVIYIPLALPLIATLSLSTAIGFWNDWNNSLYYISMEKQDLYSIQRLLKEMQDSVDFIASNPLHRVQPRSRSQHRKSSVRFRPDGDRRHRHPAHPYRLSLLPEGLCGGNLSRRGKGVRLWRSGISRSTGSKIPSVLN